MFEHFGKHELETDRGVIFARVGGSGPPPCARSDSAVRPTGIRPIS
jgi:hypothetical protein